MLAWRLRTRVASLEQGSGNKAGPSFTGNRRKRARMDRQQFLPRFLGLLAEAELRIRRVDAV